MITETLEASVQERIAKYLNQQNVKPTFFTKGIWGEFFYEGLDDIFLYDNTTKEGILPFNGYTFPIEAILDIRDSEKETSLSINLRMAKSKWA